MTRVTIEAPQGYRVDDYRKPQPGEKTIGPLDCFGKAFILKNYFVPIKGQRPIGTKVYFGDKGTEGLKEGTLRRVWSGYYFDENNERWEQIWEIGPSEIFTVEVPDPPGYEVIRYGVPEEGDLVVGCSSIVEWHGPSLGYSYIIVERILLSEKDFGKTFITDGGQVGELVAIENYADQRRYVLSCDHGILIRTPKVAPCTES